MSDAVQDHYPDETAWCYGCGRLNADGLHVQSRWESDESVARHTPDDKYIAIPGFVYGGLLASLIDCHGTGTAALAAYRAAGREPGTQPPLRFVTASLQVDFLAPTPLGVELVLRARPVEVKERKVVSEIELFAGDQVTVRGRVVAVLAPDAMFER
ncbi:PaaI family thioesterase [Calidifontibacter sp. DB0510]|uniref:PaaI family thioesterase n=1 Tax=Metallococcus carri TaxID=1656884 RepID=A0A967AXF0_9MICO|nr:PaaI family thioesterase [Metallococcus carri]NHN54488.1 PaaI family thioesterase [Metallococcus carri]NOP36673.1 PaaI family thioesterase [Calidifontibacter sp. DB2511S]